MTCRQIIIKPLLKWAGGKRWLLPVLQQIWLPYKEQKLVEPFAGGLAIALGLNPKQAILNDANIHLINFYRQVSKGLQITLPLKNNADFYYAMRTEFNQLILARKQNTKRAASLFYFLMRTGFNGLCRFNSKGEFNVPFGQHNNIKYRTDFFDYKDIMQKWDFAYGDFKNVARGGDEFLYADPPYDVEFTKYSGKNFMWDDQLRLATWLLQHDGPIIASNQATPRIKELYADLKFKIYLLPAPRMISCNGDRTPAIEILATKNLSRANAAKLTKFLAQF